MGIALRKYFKDLANYKQLHKLGQGACGEVFLAEELESGARVAIKYINEVGDPRDQRSFIREIVVPLKLNLPGIVKLIGFRFPEPAVGGSAGQPAVIITELMPNGTLEAAMKAKFANKPSPEFGPTGFSKTIFGVASTMAQVHKHCAIHRDLKPGNIFLDANWEPRIADFGLAKIVTNGVKMTMAIGSPMFMAPELFDDDDAYTFAVDVFAFGMLIYTMFTKDQVFKAGEKPMRGPQQLMMRVAKGERFMRQPGIPDHFWKLITDCWAQAPASRPTFEAVVDLFLKSDAYVFEGTDMAKYREYRERMKPQEEEPVAEVTRAASEGDVGLKMSALARDGNRMFTEELSKSIQRSTRAARPGDDAADQALRRYDFTRLKLKKK
jgi:serine/threonine protein kinase